MSVVEVRGAREAQQTVPLPLGGMSEIATDRRDNGVATMCALIAAVFTADYMLPWLVAAARGKANHWSVFWVNLLLGWTLVGWIIALIIAMGPHHVISVSPR